MFIEQKASQLVRYNVDLLFPENTQLMEKKELNRLAFQCDSDSRSHCSRNSQTTSCNANFPCSPAFPRHQLQTFGVLGMYCIVCFCDVNFFKR